MADNTTLDVGTGGDTIRSEDRSGVKTQVVGLDLNVGGVTEILCSAGQQLMAASLPVVIASNQSAIPVSGTFWQATQPVSIASVPTHAVTQGTSPWVTSVSGSVSVTQGGAFIVECNQGESPWICEVSPAGGAMSVTGPLTDAQLRATEVPVSIASVPPHAVTNAGTFAVQASQVGTWTVQPGNTANTTAWLVTGTGGSFPVTDSGGSLTVDNAGTFAVQAVQSGTWTVQPGNTANATPWLVSDTPATSGGLSIYSFLSTAAVQVASVKASAGQVYALHFFNVGAAAVYVRLYNMATTPGTGDTVVYRGIIPGNTAGAGFVVPIPPGVAFGTGIGIRVTAAVADNDNTALTANGVTGNVFYK